jgi:hypothetical protein
MDEAYGRSKRRKTASAGFVKRLTRGVKSFWRR